MQEINPDSENILILAVTGTVLSAIWLGYKLNLFKFISTIDEKKILLPSFLLLISPFLFPFIFKIIFNNNMLSQPNAINSGIVGAVITGIFLMINTQWMTSVNNKLQLEREEQQRTWQLEREEQQRTWQLEREKQQRIWQEESDKRRWYREKTYDSYKKLIQSLTNIIQLQVEIKDNEAVSDDKYTNLTKLYVEFGSEFTMIMTGHPDKDCKEFEEKKVKIFSEALDLEKDPWLAREMITQIMEDDLRINTPDSL